MPSLPPDFLEARVVGWPEARGEIGSEGGSTVRRAGAGARLPGAAPPPDVRARGGGARAGVARAAEAVVGGVGDGAPAGGRGAGACEAAAAAADTDGAELGE